MDIEEIMNSQQLKAKLLRIEGDLPHIRKELKIIFQNHKANSECGNPENPLLKCQDGLQNIFGKSDYMYQVSTRIKKPDSLVKKIVEKLYEGKKLYRNVDRDNYNKIVTDLVGVRIIHKFPDEWKAINQLIYDCFYKGENKYITNYLTEYEDGSLSPFLVEKPVVYHLPDEDLSMYKSVEKESGISFRYKSMRNYRSIHYIINFHGVYCEIQVRTLSDELWGEVEHDFVYKQEISSTKDRLSDAAALFRIILSAGDAVSMYMKEMINGREETADQYWLQCHKKVKDADQIMKTGRRLSDEK